jgi:hypothetical protein
MTEQDRFLQLLGSAEIANVELALQIVRGKPDFQPLVDNYLELYHCFVRPDLAQIEADHIVGFNQSFLSVINHPVAAIPAAIGQLKHLHRLTLQQNQLDS